MGEYIFVSHSSREDGSVRELVEFLEVSGVPCWVSYRDIPPGADWAETIYDAIESSAGMILVLDEHANRSRQIRNELDIATNLGKTIIPIRLQRVQLSKSVMYFTNSHQWIDATGGWKSAADRLLASAAGLMERSCETRGVQVGGDGGRRKWTAVILFMLMAIMVAVAIMFFGGASGSGNRCDLPNLIAGGTDSWDYATDIMAGPDGGFTATGTWDWGFWSIWWIARFDSEGEIEWSWTDSLSGEDKPLMVPASGGDLICSAGGYSDFDHTGFPLHAIRLDSSGTEIWYREWWLEWEGAVQPEMAAMEMCTDSLIYCFLTLRQLSSEPLKASHQVVFDASGGFAGRDTLREGDTARELIVLEGDRLLRVYRELPSRANGIEIVEGGGEVARRIVIGDARSYVTCGLEMPDGNILLFMTEDTYGANMGDLSLKMFTQELELIWERSYGGAMPETILDAALLPSGEIIAAGYSSSWGDGTKDGWVMKLDQDGDLVWQSVMDMGGEDYLSALSVMDDGCICAAGVTSSYGQPDAWLLSLTGGGEWNDEKVIGHDLFLEDWEKGFIDQTVWEMGFNRNYAPVLHRDSVTYDWSFDSNNVPVVTISKFPLVPGLCLSTAVTIPAMEHAGGSNWVALGLTRGSADDFYMDPVLASDMQFRWTYTSGSNGQRRELASSCMNDSLICTSSEPESLWLQRDVPQDLTIEICERAVRFWVNDSLFVEDAMDPGWEQDSVSVFIWGSSSALPHYVDDVRLFMRRW